MINVQNIDDNECFNWSIVGYVNPADLNPAGITKANKEFAKKLDVKDIKFPVKIRDIHKFEKKNSVRVSVFGYENEEKHPSIYQKNVVKKNVDLLLTGKVINRKRRKETLCFHQRF